MNADPQRDLWAAYERAFRSLLWRVHPRQLQRGIERLQRKAAQRAEQVDLRDALRETYRAARKQVIRHCVRRAAAARCRGPALPASPARLPTTKAAAKVERLLNDLLPLEPSLESPDFHCDAAMGGLARWLRAAGYDAAWWPGIDDDDLLGKALASSAILLTTDRRLMQRGVIVHGVIAALLVPISLNREEQFAWTVRRLDLPLRAPRCMACGGPLRRVEKTAVRERIPPRTYLWRDDYYLCTRCDKLFWEGTHWQRIGSRLDRLRSDDSANP